MPLPVGSLNFVTGKYSLTSIESKIFLLSGCVELRTKDLIHFNSVGFNILPE